VTSTETGAGPVVLITGATGGIGSAVGAAYAGRGARLVLLARSAGMLDQLARRLEPVLAASGAPAPLVVVADVADPDGVDKAVAAGLDRFGRLDVVVHTVAVVAYGRLVEVPRQVWDRVVTVGVLGTSNVARAALPVFEAQRGGHLVVIGSILGRVSAPTMGAYVTAKFAVRGLVRVLQQEARRTPGVHVALVEPGAVDTAIYPLAANYVGRIGRPPPPVADPTAVARAVLTAVDRRRSAASVGWANPLMRLGFAATPWLYDRLVGPLMRVAGLSRQPTADHPGNVFTPSQDVPIRPPDPTSRSDLPI
jgi:NAD(P)-dependent dehydrogenase (short-subunit alcohol dehydrogenase family)